MNPEIVDSYPLSPMQEGMLFHSLSAPASDLYTQQLVSRLHEEIDVSAFKQAWTAVAERHDVFRTSFRWERLDAPVQEVHRTAHLPFEFEAWSDLGALEQDEMLKRYLEADRRRGFDFSSAPLIRLALFQLSAADYVFVWTSHHSILDGRSRLSVLKEAFAFYQARLSDGDARLPPTPPYKEFISFLRRQDWSEAETFWGRHLRGYTAPSYCASNFTSAPEFQLGHQPEAEHCWLTREETAALKDFTRQHQLSIGTLLQGAWALLLAKYSGHGEVVFGAIRAGRRIPVEASDAIVGLLINTVPMRVNVTNKSSLLSLVKELREQNIQLRQFEHTPLVKIQEWSELPVHQPLFDSIVMFENYILTAALRSQSPEWQQREFELHERTNYPLAVLGYGGDQLHLKIAYESYAFQKSDIIRMLHQLRLILTATMVTPELAPSKVSLTDQRERDQILFEWNNTRSFYPPRCIHPMFEDQVAQRPEAIALRCEEHTVSYGELNERANKLAHYLQSRGVGPEVLVGICLERSVEMIVAILAVLKAGGGYVPLDPSYPEARLELMIADSGLRLLLQRGTLRAGMQAGGVTVVDLEQEGEAIAAAEKSNPVSAVSSDNLAYVIYTSGSTGKPKGVMVEHKGICNLIQAQNVAFEVNEDSRVLQFSSMSFDASVSEIFTTLTAGACLCLPPQQYLPVGESLSSILNDQKISHVTLPPSILSSVLVNNLPELKTIISAGEACHEEIAAACIKEKRFLNAYGPTEVTVCASMYLCTDAKRYACIGRPISNAQIYLLGSELQPVPVGMVGELYVGGIGLARGYLNRPQLTAANFIPDPFSKRVGARLYRTGDTARYRSDGTIDFVGRVDDQAKIRGFRIETGEIEATLRRHENIDGAVVVVAEDAHSLKRLVAYYTANQRSFQPGELREFLRVRLPEHLIPAAFIQLETFPVTPNGKIDRHALRQPRRFQRESSTPYVPPSNKIEKTLCDIWCHVLGIDRAGIEDNLFDLGGNSLLVMQLSSRIHTTFNVRVPLAGIMKNPTIAGLAKQIESISNDGSELFSSPILPADRTGDLPLSFAQQGLWLLDRFQPEVSLYNVRKFLSLEGPLEVPALEQAFLEVVRRHEILRTTFAIRDGKPIQCIQPWSGPLMSIADFSTLPQAEKDIAIKNLSDQHANLRFNLETGPLFGVLLIRIERERHLLLLTLHHIVCDGWSIEILLTELAEYYRASVLHDTPKITELKLQYADYAQWQRSLMIGDKLTRQLDYWREQLHGATPLHRLPTDHPRQALQSFWGATFEVVLPATLNDKLSAISRAANATLFMTLLAAFKVLLFRYGGAGDVVVGTPVAGRSVPETESLIGFFVNTLVLRSKLDAGMSFFEVLERERDVCLDAYEHRDIPFEKVVEELKPERTLSHTPVFQIMFSLMSWPGRPFRLPGVEIKSVPPNRATSKFDLTLSIIEALDGTLQTTWQYSTDLFEAETIERMSRHWRHLLEEIVACPHRAISELRLLSADERGQQVVSWNQSAGVEAVPEQLVHSLFEHHARGFPMHTALICAEESLSYGELNERANKLAHCLQSRGVGPEVLVGICLERSVEMIVAILAVLKAGGGYVPLDPSYPEARLELMIADSGLRLLLQRGTLRTGMQAGGVTVVDVEQEGEAIAAAEKSNPVSAVSSDNLAYVIYTSGSTGKPKGVAIAHRQLTNYVAAVSQRMMLPAGSRLALVSTFAADLGHTMLFPSLCGGHTLHVISELMSLDAVALSNYFHRHEIDAVKITPSHLRGLIGRNPRGRAIIPRRLLITGGEALSWDFVADIRRLNSACRLMNHYGPTETTVGTLTYELSAESEASVGPLSRSAPLGHPLPQTTAYILDKHLEPGPIGVTGELYIGGFGLARCYLNDPVATAERFIPNPFAMRAGERLYRTGDLARWLPSGVIEFQGRHDQQIKLRGFRIELDEIAVILAKHKAVAEAAAIVHTKESHDKRIVAYVTARQGATLDVNALREHARKYLPLHMLPSAFVFLERLPMTANSKLDREALPDPDVMSHHEEAPSIETLTPTEEILAEIFSQMLGVERVRVNDNFFELGGHSLLAVQVLSRIQEILNVELPLRVFLEAPTIGELSQALLAHETKPGQTETIARLVIDIRRNPPDGSELH